MSRELTNGHGPQIGQPCPRASCDGVLKVLNSRARPEINRRFRYLGCAKCGARPEDNLQVVPLQYAPPRAPRS